MSEVRVKDSSPIISLEPSQRGAFGGQSDHAGDDEPDGQSEPERGDQHTDEHAVVYPVHTRTSSPAEVTIVLKADGPASYGLL